MPVAYFQALGRTERDSGQSDKSAGSNKQAYHPDSGYSDNSGAVEALRSPDPVPRQSKPKDKPTGAMVYGIVMYDFAAERPDELEAKAGEAIIVIAQSNPEWFVAKPIGRLGGPGLIPVSFIEIRDMGSGQAVPDAQEAVQRAGVPKVEEWKKMAADYKNSSITLGKFEVPNAQQQQALEQSMDRMSLQQQPGRQSNQSNGQGYVSVRFQCIWAYANFDNSNPGRRCNQEIPNKVNRCNHRLQLSRRNGRPLNCMHQYLLRYLDSALPKRSTGLLLKQH